MNDPLLSQLSDMVSQGEFWEPRSVSLDVAYWVAAMCVSFKSIWIIRMVGQMPFWQRWPVTASAIFLSTTVMVKALSRFYGGDPATLFAIFRELGLCFFLASTISLICRQTKRL